MDPGVRQDTPGSELPTTPDVQAELRIHNDLFRTEINAIRAILEVARRRADEIRIDLDRWAAQAERRAHPAQASPITLVRRGWWPF